VRRPGDILRGISRARQSVALYGADHPVAAQTIGDVHAVTEPFLEERPLMRFVIHDDTFYFGKTVMLDESLRLSPFLEDLREREIGVMELHEGLEPWELARFAEALNVRPEEISRRGGVAAQLAEKGVRRIVVGAAHASVADEHAEIRVEAGDVYRAALRVVDDLYFKASRDLPLDLRMASTAVASFIDLLAQDRAALLGVAILRHYDEDTYHHCVKVCILSLMMGMHLGMERSLLITLGLSALLHDIGKVRVPPEILAKTGQLTTEEREIVKRHTLYGAHLLRNLSGVTRLAMVVAFEHHVNFDLSGYPRIVTKDMPHLLTRIVQPAEVFDAATSAQRAYRAALVPHEAMRLILRSSGTIFDPVLARAFVRVMGLYPVGSVVELDSGELALVVRPGVEDTARPLVKIITNTEGEPVEAFTVNLEEEAERRIIQAVDPQQVRIDGLLSP
jgi:putative nucleotidyltransferase with HDIG domain